MTEAASGPAGPDATAAPPRAAPPAGQTAALPPGAAVYGLPLADGSLAGPLGAAGAALFVVLGLIWLASKAASLRGFARPAGASGRLSVAAQTPLDARRRLVLVACAGRQVLLLTGGPADLVVGWLPPDAGQSGAAPLGAGTAGAAS